MEISEREYDHLVKVAEENPREKFCIVKFITGFLNHKFLAMLIASFGVGAILVLGLVEAESTLNILIIVWGVTLFAFILGKSLDYLIQHNTKVNVELKAGATVTASNESKATVEKPALKGESSGR